MHTRRILLLSSLIGAFLGFAAPAAAGPITVGSQIKLYVGVGGNGGGEFLADVSPFGTPYDFVTFCLQRNEYFTPGATMFVGGITNQVVQGNDPISNQTAYLYTQFSNGTLANYAFSGNVVYNGQTYNHAATSTALQMAFWYLEDEVTRLANGTFKDAYSSTIFAADALTDFYINLANNSGWTSIGNVRVLNLYASYNPTTGVFSNNQQDQLVLLPAPEPGSMILLGTGLLGAAAVFRRARRRRTQPR